MKLKALVFSIVGLVLAATLPVLAKTALLQSGSTTLAFQVPDSWKVSTVQRGLEIKSPDEEIFMWVEAYRRSDLDKIKAEHGKYFASQGVAMIGEPKIKAEGKAKYGLAFMDIEATWKGKPTVLRYIMVEPTDASKRSLIVSYWASPEGDKEHAAAMSKLIENLGAAVDATH